MNEKLKSWGSLIAEMSKQHAICMSKGKIAGQEIGLNVIRSMGKELFMGGKLDIPSLQESNWAVTGKSLKAYIDLAKKNDAYFVSVACEYEARNTLGGDIIESLVPRGVEWCVEVWNIENGWLF